MLNQDCPTARRVGLMALMTASMLGVFAPCVSAAPTATQLTEGNMSTRHGQWAYQPSGCDQVWLTYYDEGGNLRLRDPAGKHQLLEKEGGAGKQTGLAMAALESGVSILWRDKFPTKGLYLKRTDKPEEAAIEVASETEVLTRFEALRHENQLHLLWYGERQHPDSNSLYHLYHRVLDLSDQTLSPTERLMPGFYPMMAMDDKGNILVASWLDREKPAHLAARFRSVETQAFGPSVKIAAVPNMAPIYRAFENGGRWFVLWLGMDQERQGEFLLEGAYSDDAGTTWLTFAAEELRGIDVSSLDLATNDDGHILIALSGRYRKDPDVDKHKLFLLRSEDNGTTWSLAPPLQSTDALDTFNAKRPMVAFGQEKGEVLVVWEDWRQIRSRLYASFSKDHGKTWVIDNLPLPHAPNINLGLRSSGHNLWADQCGRFHLIANQAEDDRLARFKLVELSFTTEDLFHLSKEPRMVPGKPLSPAQGEAVDESPTPSEAVRKRATDFWQAMVKADYATTYEFYDPFYRANSNHLQYQLNMGRVKYDSFEIREIGLKGPFATMDVKMTVSVPPFIVPATGERVERPAEEITLKDKWLWVDDDWYREYHLETYDKRWTQY